MMMNAEEILQRLDDMESRLSRVCQYGVISAADYPNAMVKVQLNEEVTDWLKWFVHSAGDTVEWRAPKVGEQVMVFAPSGNLVNAMVLPGIYSTAHPAPNTDPNIHLVNFGDGSSVEYDETAHTLTVSVVGADAVVNADGKVNITAGGDVNATAGGNANVKATGDVKVDGANIILNGGAKGGTVCQQDACSFTGAPHPSASSTVKAG